MPARSPLPRLALLLAAALAPAASAAPMQRAVRVDVQLVPGLAVPSIFLSGAGTATVDATAGHVTSLSLPAGLVATQGTATLPGGNLEIRVDARNGAGQLAEGAGPLGGFGGTLPVLGTLRICLGATCDATPFADIQLPLDVVGAGGTTSTPGGVFRVVGAPWSTAVLTLSGTGFVSYLGGFRQGPSGNASSTSQVGGILSVVTPARVEIPTIGAIDFVVVMDVQLVPEPTGPILVATGLLGLLAVARRRPDRAGA